MVFRVHLILARWLSWLERRPVTAEVEGSSPFRVVFLFIRFGIIAQLGEHLPYKQGVTGSSPVGPINENLYADVAQLAEQLICNQQVIGSSPIIGFCLKRQFNNLKTGRVPERPMGADCKSVVDDFEGSNPSPPTEIFLKST